MRREFVRPFWGTRITDLRALSMTDARMYVQTTFGHQADGGQLIIDQALTNIHPMAEISGDIQRGECLKNRRGGPWRMEDATAMEFVRDRDRQAAFVGGNSIEEIKRLRAREGITPAVAVDQARTHAGCELALLLERVDMRRHVAAWNKTIGEYLRHQTQAQIRQP